MKIQQYFTLLVLVTVIALIGAAEWTQSKNSAADQRDAFYSSLSHQASSFEQSIKARIENLRYQLAQAASRHTEQTSSLTNESPFSAIAWLRKNPEGSAAKYKAVWAEANTQTFDPTWLKGLNFSQIKDGETLFVRRVDRNGNAFFALIMTAVAQHADPSSALPEETNSSVDDRVYLFGAVSSSTLSAWADDWVGSSKAALVFDEHGNVVSHSQRQYSGTNLKTDKFVNASIRSGRGKLTTEFADLESEARVGESLRVGQTNLRAAISIPKSILTKPMKNESGSQRGLMITVGLFLVGLTYFVSGRYANKLSKSTPQSSVAHVPTATAATTAPLLEEESVQVVNPEPEITFEQVEQKTRVNLNEILARSAEIRQRLQIDFVESVESEQKLFFEELESTKPASIEVDQEVAHQAAVVETPLTDLHTVNELPKIKVRRPKVSL